MDCTWISPLQNVKFVQRILRFSVDSIPKSVQKSHTTSTFLEATYDFGAIDFTLDYLFQKQNTISTPATGVHSQHSTFLTHHKKQQVVPEYFFKVCKVLLRKGQLYSIVSAILECVLRNNNCSSDPAKRQEVIKDFFAYDRSDLGSLLSHAVLCNTKNLEKSIRFVIEQAHRFSVLRNVLDSQIEIHHTRQTPLMGLIETNNKMDIAGAAKLLIDAGTRIKKQESELLVACLKNRYDLDVARLLLNSPSIDVNDRINVKAVVDSKNLLTDLAFHGKLKAMELLINKAIEDGQSLNLEIPDSQGLLPIHACLSCGARTVAILKLLKEKGANMNAKTMGQEEKRKAKVETTAAKASSPPNNSQVASPVKEKSTERWFSQKQKGSRTILHNASCDYVSVPAGVTAFHLIAHSSLTSQSSATRIEIMKTMVELGMSANEKDDDGDLPLDYSKLSHDSPEVTRFLESITTAK